MSVPRGTSRIGVEPSSTGRRAGAGGTAGAAGGSEAGTGKGSAGGGTAERSAPAPGAGCAGSMKNMPFDEVLEDIAAFRSGIFRWALASSGSTSASSGVTTSLPDSFKANP